MRIEISNSFARTALSFIGIFFIGLPIWVHGFFGTVSVDQILMTIQFATESALNSDHLFLIQFTIWCVIVPTLFSCLIGYFDKSFTRKLPIILLMIGPIASCYQFNVYHTIKQMRRTKNDYFHVNYVDPHAIAMQVVQPKSLILIYVESLEDTYANKQLFGKDLIAPLEPYKQKYISFDHYQQMPGTGWTIAAITSTQCSVPLNLMTMLGSNKQGEQFKHFLIHAKCLGDILSDHGYQNIFMNGSSSHYSGILNFFQTHHYQFIYGKEEWLTQRYHENEMSQWGLYDDDLFKEAKLEVTHLMQTHQLFNLTLLTIDTHGPDGYYSKTCRAQGAHDFDGIVNCTANQLADFIHYIDQQGWLNKVNIVILGDHLAMHNPDFNKLESIPHRSIFNLLISDQALHANTHVITHFDMLPTILESLGFQIPGHRLGLGYSGIAPYHAIQPTNRLSEMESHVGNYSKTYNALWA